MAKVKITLLKEADAARTHAQPQSSYWWDPISVQTPSGVKNTGRRQAWKVESSSSCRTSPDELIGRLREGREGYWIKPLPAVKLPRPSPEATAPAPQPKLEPALSAKSPAQPDEGGKWGALATAQRYCTFAAINWEWSCRSRAAELLQVPTLAAFGGACGGLLADVRFGFSQVAR